MEIMYTFLRDLKRDQGMSTIALQVLAVEHEIPLLRTHGLIAVRTEHVPQLREAVIRHRARLDRLLTPLKFHRVRYVEAGGRPPRRSRAIAASESS